MKKFFSHMNKHFSYIFWGLYIAAVVLAILTPKETKAGSYPPLVLSGNELPSDITSLYFYRYSETDTGLEFFREDDEEAIHVKIGDMVAFDFSCDYFEDLDRRHPIGKCYYVDKERQAMFLGIVKSIKAISIPNSTYKIEVDVYGTLTTRWGELRLGQYMNILHIFKSYSNP